MKKRKLKLKPYVLPSLYVLSALLLVMGVYFYGNREVAKPAEDIDYVSDEINGYTVPVIATGQTIMTPYSDTSVTVARDFYDYQSDASLQESALVSYDGVYMQNSRIDYSAANPFAVLAVLDGTVIEVEDTELFGKSVTIQHDNNLISTYQGLTDVKVSKDDKVFQGQTIATSGTSIINQSLGNHVHFELYLNGTVLNPNLAIGKTLKELTTE